MKKFFLFFVSLILFFRFGSCGDIAIADDICAITTDICWYAQAICEVYSTPVDETASPQILKDQLVQASQNLQNLYSDLNQFNKLYSPDTEEIFRTELTKIRDRLKSIYEKKKENSQ